MAPPREQATSASLTQMAVTTGFATNAPHWVQCTIPYLHMYACPCTYAKRVCNSYTLGEGQHFLIQSQKSVRPCSQNFLGFTEGTNHPTGQNRSSHLAGISIHIHILSCLSTVHMQVIASSGISTSWSRMQPAE